MGWTDLNIKNRWEFAKVAELSGPIISLQNSTHTFFFQGSSSSCMARQENQHACKACNKTSWNFGPLSGPPHRRNYIIRGQATATKLLNIEASNLNMSQIFYRVVIMWNNIKRCSSETWAIGYYASTEFGWSINVNDFKIVNIIHMDDL